MGGTETDRETVSEIEEDLERGRECKSGIETERERGWTERHKRVHVKDRHVKEPKWGGEKRRRK